eukprot:m.57807 g.57807  ORF g.57807 m.57807 type:complete len:196 (-) comp7103_c0_seq1:434-1021(-)
MQQIVVVAGGADGHLLLNAAVASIQEAQKYECPAVRLCVSQPRDAPSPQCFVPKDALGKFTRKKLCNDIHRYEHGVRPLRVYLLCIGSVNSPLRAQEIEVIKKAINDANRERTTASLEDHQHTYDEMKACLQEFKPHVWQYFGHNTRRIFGVDFNSAAVARLLAQKKVRCAILNCCSGGDVAQEFRRQGLPFVIF